MVEWKKLGDVCELKRGVRVVKKGLQEEGQIPVFQNSLTPLGYFEKSNYPENTPFVICAGAAGDVGFSKESFWAADDCTCILCSPLVNSKYIYYFLLVKQLLLKSQVRKASVPRLSKDVIGKLTIPIPSLSEQSRIVSILDTFTASIANLKEQIAERRKQYEYEREKLLDLERKEGVEMEKLGEVCEIKNGYTPSTKKPEFWENGSIPWFTLEDIRKNGRILSDAIKHITPTGVKKSGLFPQNSIIVSTTATIGEYALITRDFLCNQQISCISVKEATRGKLLPKYLYYLSNSIGNWCKKNVNGGGSLLIVNTNKLKNLFTPLPPLSTQSHIVSILDTFEASIANLEAQLELRQKQYEYYRNQLLTFE